MWDVRVDQSMDLFGQAVGSTAYGYYKVIIREILPSENLTQASKYQTVTLANGEKHRFYFIRAKQGVFLFRLIDWLNEGDVRNIFSKSAILVWETPKTVSGLGARIVLGGVLPDNPSTRNAAANQAAALLARTSKQQILHIEVTV